MLAPWPSLHIRFFHAWMKHVKVGVYDLKKKKKKKTAYKPKWRNKDPEPDALYFKGLGLVYRN